MGVFKANIMIAEIGIYGTSETACNHDASGEVKHLVIIKFREGVAGEDNLQGMEKLVLGMDTVKSFEWRVPLILKLFLAPSRVPTFH